MIEEESNLWPFQDRMSQSLIDERCHWDRLDSTLFPEIPDAQYPFILITGRESSRASIARFHRKARKLYPKHAFAEIHPSDAKQLGVINGAKVAVESRRGSVVVTAYVTSKIAASHVFISLHYRESDTLTLARDPILGRFEYGESVVRIRPLHPVYPR